MEKIEYLKTVNGVCYTPCPHHDEVMVGSVSCKTCIYYNGLFEEDRRLYAKCRFDEFVDEKKDTQPNSFGNRLKLKVWLDNDVNSEIGYIDGYVQKGDETLAVVYMPNRKELVTLSIDDISIINEGE